MHNVAQRYHPDNTELIPQTNYSLQDNSELVSSHQLSLHHFYLTSSDTPPTKSQHYNVQPTSHTKKPRFYPFITIHYRNSQIHKQFQLPILRSY